MMFVMLRLIIEQLRRGRGYVHRTVSVLSSILLFYEVLYNIMFLYVVYSLCTYMYI